MIPHRKRKADAIRPQVFFSLLMVLALLATAVSPALAQEVGPDDLSSQQPVSPVQEAPAAPEWGAGAPEGAQPETPDLPFRQYVAATWSDNAVHFLNTGLANTGSFAVGDSNPNGIATDGVIIYTGHYSSQSVRAFDFYGNFLFSWTDSHLAGLQGLELVNGELAVFSSATNQVHFFTTAGAYLRSIPGQGNTVEGLAYDGWLLWQLGDASIYGTNPADGSVVSTIPNAASACPFGGTGLTANAPGELTIGCQNGNWYRVSSADG